VIIWLVSVAVWFLSFLLIRALSRYREFSADRGSALLTGNPSALISALLKISGDIRRVPERDLREVEGISAFFIVPAAVKGIFSTHPPTEKRIERLRQMEREMEGIA
jgi:heat shock protein HtpX